MSDEDKRLYLDAWLKAVDVQQHFNDISWRIRALWLTALTFILGATFVAFKDAEPMARWIFDGKSPALFIPILGIFLWLGFWFVDGAWYHRLLVGSVKDGLRLEGVLVNAGIDVGLTKAIGDASPWSIPGVTLHSKHKLNAFYALGGAPILGTIIFLALE